MSKLKVLQFICPAGFYGAERWVLALANNLDHEQVECHLATTADSSGGSQMREAYPAEAGQTFDLPMASAWDFSVISRLVALIERERIQIIHSHGYKSDILALIAARRARIPCITTPHGFGKPKDLKLRLYHWLGKVSLRFFDKVVPLSPALDAEIKGWMPGRNMVLIENGVDTKEIDAIPTPTQRATDDGPIIGYIGQLIPGKQVDHIILALEALQETFPAAKLHIIGDGSERDTLEQLAADRGLGDRVEFLGFRSDRLSLLRNFDVFVLASRSEGIPRCLMESMACEVPVVAYQIEGVDLLIENDHTGLLAPLDDTDALAQHIARAIEDSTLRARLIANARSVIDTRFAARIMAREYLQLYRECLKT